MKGKTTCGSSSKYILTSEKGGNSNIKNTTLMLVTLTSLIQCQERSKDDKWRLYEALSILWCIKVYITVHIAFNLINII